MGQTHRQHPAKGPAGAAAVATAPTWRTARVHLERGEPRLALEVLDRVATVTEAARHRPDVDRAMLEACRATAYWKLGQPDLARAHAALTYDIATTVGDSGARAAAHVVLALVHSLEGQPDDVIEHYRRAATLAAEAGDRFLLARVDANLSHHLLADARYVEAAEAAHAGAAAAVRLGSPGLESVSLENEGEALVRLGRYDEAVDRYRRVLALADRLGTARTAGALVGLSQVHARRGEHEQERADLRVAYRLTSGSCADRQVRVLVLTGLARALIPVDPVRAGELAHEALAGACGSGVLPALVASSRVSRAAGDLGAAARDAARAVEHAGHRRERAWLAESLELRAETDPAPRARAALREAHGIWHQASARFDADRVLVRLASLSAAPADRVAGRVASARAAAEGLAVPALEPDVVISTFGRFEVHVAGTVVPASAWQSRRARDLLRILVVRCGPAVPRLQLCEALWPDEEAAVTSHRLSVLLSIVRGVIGVDALVADRDCVTLDLGVVRIDVQEFLHDVTDAVELRRTGSSDEARTLLAAALRRRTGEPFADTPYDDATLHLREEAHATHVQALRLMAALCRSEGDHDEAAAWLRGLLATEPYDEDAHLSLAAVLSDGGRHGQARRALARYRSAMADLGLQPAG